MPYSSRSSNAPLPTPTLLFSPKDQRSNTSAAHFSVGGHADDGCASCRISLPEDLSLGTRKSLTKNTTGADTSPPLRTTEVIHACINEYLKFQDDSINLSSTPESSCSATSASSCHTHNLEYVSNSSPAESDSFSSLRRATIRTLSGEQLPRGQTAGPLCFGDPSTGFTIAYVFRLADPHARGRQRYYALLALAGSDSRRAFEACTIIWSLFEQLARNIIETAEQVALRASLTDYSPPQTGYITPISSFLTGRTVDPDGHPRHGAANVRASGIAELVDNENFFCELHMIFVCMLQDLGKLLGGIRVMQPIVDKYARLGADGQVTIYQYDNHKETREDSTTAVPKPERTSISDAPRMMTQSPTSCYATIMLSHPVQVLV